MGKAFNIGIAAFAAIGYAWHLFHPAVPPSTAYE
jgi:hypothetical protein